MPPFITIPKQYASDYRERRISKSERQMIEWLRQLANPYGIAVVDLPSLAIDCLPNGSSTNYANKLLLSLKRKRYIYYQERNGRRGSFEVHVDLVLLPNKEKRNPPPIKTLSRFFEEDADVRGGALDANLPVSEEHTEDETLSQRSLEIRMGVGTLISKTSPDSHFRGSYTDTEKEKETETNRSLASFNKENSRRNLSVEKFRPQSEEEGECLAIAMELDETDMSFLIGTKNKYGMPVINKVLDHCRSTNALERAENKAALFNSILQQFVTKGFL